VPRRYTPRRPPPDKGLDKKTANPTDDSVVPAKQQLPPAKQLSDELRKFYPENYTRMLSDNETQNVELRRLYTHLLASELSSADTSSFARMNSMDDVRRHSYILGALAEPPSTLRDFWIGRFDYTNRTWLDAYLGERNDIERSDVNTIAGWRGAMEARQLAAFQQMLKWSRMVEQVDGHKQFANEATLDLARFIVHCSTSHSNSSPTFLTAEQHSWLESVAAEIEIELQDFDGQEIQKLKWWRGKLGAPPHLSSAKIAGFGVSLRAVTGDDQTSAHVYQGDIRNMHDMTHAHGAISYCAGEQTYTSAFSNHSPFSLPGPEFVGSSGSVRTAVDGRFVNLGGNAIRRPVYDLGFVQFSELTSSPHSPAWPSYHSRSVGLVGTDYMIIYDDVRHGELCFDWSSPADSNLNIISSAPRRETKTLPTATAINETSKNAKATKLSRYLFDSNSVHGMTLVSPNPIDATTIRDGRKQAVGYRVRTQNCTDYVLQSCGPPTTEDELIELKKRYGTSQLSPTEISFENADVKFIGSAGVLRLHQDGTREAALIRGRKIDAWGLQLEVDNSDYAIGLRADGNEQATPRLSGWAQGDKAVTVRVALTGDVTPPFTTLAVWSDGKQIQLKPNQSSLQFTLPAGRHRFVIAPANEPQLIAPSIRNVETVRGKARLTWTMVEHADSYRIELSQDGLSFTSLATTAGAFYEIAGLKEGARFFVRVVPLRKRRAGPPSSIALAHITNQTPVPPAGLAIDWLDVNTVGLRWGSVLGARDYKVYRRPVGVTVWESVHYGSENHFKDNAPGAAPAIQHPYYYDDRVYQAYGTQFEYAVTAINGLGESKKSKRILVLPNSWQAYRSRRESQLIEGKLRGPFDVFDYFRIPD
ncbi:MAG: hypothetical protein ACI9HK_002645, partial [Pirellulaceae bacterium]